MQDKPVTTDFRWRGINLHDLLGRFEIHSMTEEDHLLDHASVQNDHNLRVLGDIMQQAYEMNR